MTASKSRERRRAVRVDAQLSLQVHLPLSEGPTEVETINVSSAGMYFRSPEFVEPMTKLELTFDLPIGEEDVATVECEGIVVRTQPELPDGEVAAYEVAVFFTTIDERSHESLERYLESRLRALTGD
jgi:c-di-GMP-binding flagellar brake protein YcgR